MNLLRPILWNLSDQDYSLPEILLLSAPLISLNLEKLNPHNHIVQLVPSPLLVLPLLRVTQFMPDLQLMFVLDEQRLLNNRKRKFSEIVQDDEKGNTKGLS